MDYAKILGLKKNNVKSVFFSCIKKALKIIEEGEKFSSRSGNVPDLAFMLRYLAKYRITPETDSWFLTERMREYIREWKYDYPGFGMSAWVTIKESIVKTETYLPESNISSKIIAYYYGYDNILFLRINGILVHHFYVDLFLKPPHEISSREFYNVNNVDIRALLVNHIGSENLHNVLKIKKEQLLDSYDNTKYSNNHNIKSHKYMLYNISSLVKAGVPRDEDDYSLIRGSFSVFTGYHPTPCLLDTNFRILMFKHATTGRTLVEFVKGNTIEEALDFRLGGGQKSSLLKEAF